MNPRNGVLGSQVVMSPTDTGGAGGGAASGGSGEPGGGGAGGGEAGSLTPEALREFMGGLGDLGREIRTLNGHITAAASRSEEEPESTSESAEGEQGEPVDLDSLSRSELLDLIRSNNHKDLLTMLKPIAEEITRLGNNMTQQQLGRDIQELAGGNKDFWDWKDEMQAIADQNPNMSVERVYKLAKAENPAKAEELRNKYAPKRVEDKPRFGGLQPGRPGQQAANKAMSMSDALEDAWSKTMERHGDVLNRFAT